MKDVGQRGFEVAALKHAVPYLEMLRGKAIVIKVGGALLADDRAVAALTQQLGVFYHLGIRCVLVHGGGPQTTELSRALGLEVQMIAGRRVTDEKTLEVATMVLNGAINTRLVAACRAAALPAVGLSGADAATVRARRRPPTAVAGHPEPIDFGHVGDIEGVDTRLLEHLLAGSFLPIVSPLSADASGALLNINADSVAAAIAVSLKAEKFIVVSDSLGLLADPDDPGSLVSYCDLARLAELRARGAIRTGMLPKTTALEAALAGGVPRAHLVSFKVPDALLLEVFTNEGCGTLVVPELAVLTAEEKLAAD